MSGLTPSIFGLLSVKKAQSFTNAEKQRGRENLGLPSTIDYEHVQSSPSSTWTINHNLGRYPNSVKVMNAGRVQLLAQVTDTSVNQTIINFASAQTGTVQIS